MFIWSTYILAGHIVQAHARPEMRCVSRSRRSNLFVFNDGINSKWRLKLLFSIAHFILHTYILSFLAFVRVNLKFSFYSMKQITQSCDINHLKHMKYKNLLFYGLFLQNAIFTFAH